MLRLIKDTLYITAGVLMAGFGLKGFLLPNKFIDGGITGISLLVSQLTGIHLSLLLVLINIPFIVLGFTNISKTFAIKSVIAIAGLAICLVTINYPVVTDDRLLVSIFGGFFLGAGIGLTMRGGGVIDGTEVLAIYLNRKTPFSIGGIILVINIFIFSIAALLLSIETALYSMLIYLAASKTVDFVVHGIEEYIGMTVISDRSEEIRLILTEKHNKGVTIINGRRGLSYSTGENANIDIIYTVVTRLETPKVKNEILAIDKNAFITEHTINEVKGGIVKRKPYS